MFLSPVLTAPDFDKQFKLYVDASDVGAGAVLQQENDQGIDHSINYFSRKFEDTQRRYYTIKKETLALLLGLKHFAYVFEHNCRTSPGIQ